MAEYDFDFTVIGGGAAGLVAAKFSAGTGKRTAMFEKNRIGGECTWSGCVPSKTLLSLSSAVNILRTPGNYGVELPGMEIPEDYNPFRYVRSVVENVYNGHPPIQLEKEGIQVVEGSDVKFVDPHTVEVDGKQVSSSKFLIATGSSPFVPDLPGLNEIDYYTNETIFSLDSVPASISIIGGGPIGCELAQAFNSLGSRVTIVERLDSIMYREDSELSTILTEEMKKSGITIHTETDAVSLEKKNGITVHCRKGDKSLDISSDVLLIAIGRKPNLEGLNLEAVGVRTTPKGVVTDNRMRTTVPNIYAAGDVVGPYQFSHMAEYQAVIASTNALLPVSRRAEYSNVPWVTFTRPEFARSGLTEKEARDIHGSRLRIYTHEYSSTDRAVTDGKTTGRAKIICDRKWKILGISILGERAGEVMQEAHLAKVFDLPLYKIAQAVHAYPLYSDVIRQPAKKAWIDSIRNNCFVRFAKFISGKK